MAMPPEVETKDEVMAELLRIKRELAEEYDFDVSRIAEATRKKQASYGREIIMQPERPVRPD